MKRRETGQQACSEQVKGIEERYPTGQVKTGLKARSDEFREALFNADNHRLSPVFGV